MRSAYDISTKNLVKSIREGAYPYILKHNMADIDRYLADVICGNSKAV